MLISRATCDIECGVAHCTALSRLYVVHLCAALRLLLLLLHCCHSLTHLPYHQLTYYVTQRSSWKRTSSKIGRGGAGGQTTSLSGLVFMWLVEKQCSSKVRAETCAHMSFVLYKSQHIDRRRDGSARARFAHESWGICTSKPCHMPLRGSASLQFTWRACPGADVAG